MKNNKDVYQESSLLLFLATLNNFFEKETFAYCFYDFPREEMKEKNALFIMIERMKQDKKYIKNFCDEMNKKLEKYDITSVCNIICGKTYKYPKRIDIPIQINNGYYYSFTVVCKKKHKET
jgi:hypothetical protein